ncbi:MAG: hypothetical protein JNJ73_15375 [Hyphomonadaceae bacterium]|nr:hypothetical protein [Hyphomonadaceae bacterium]
MSQAHPRRKLESIEAAADWLAALPGADPAGMSLVLAKMYRAAAWNVHLAETMLQASRHVIDVSREVLRQQQDATLRAWREQIEAASSSADTDQLAPFAAVGKAAFDMSSAMLQAQRGAVQAFADQARNR